MNPALFWSHVGGGCWIWEGNVNEYGYGRVRVRGRLRAAHRVAYELAIGPVPNGSHVRHLCKNKSCVRPDHLKLCHVVRLTPHDVESIRKSRHTNSALGQHYGVSRVRIQQIRSLYSATYSP